MSKFKLKFKLKQHTPLIHFQHDQKGATLRATELKPKLDKFILMKIGQKADSTLVDTKQIYQKGIEIAKKNNWLLGDSEALDYKVKIECNGDIQYYLPLPFISNRKRGLLKEYIDNKLNRDITLLVPSPYFANSDKIEYYKINGMDAVNESKTKINEIRFAQLSNTDIDVCLYSFKTSLSKIIEDNIVSFFLRYNFGTRQNKGFGSFTVKSLNGKEIKESDLQLKAVFIHKSKGTYRGFSELFGFILEEYQLLKSGKNHPNYKKSELFNYFVQKGIRWEKRYIKQFINNASNRIMSKELYSKTAAPIDFDNSTSKDYNDWFDKQKNNYKYIRALLGLSEQFEYTVFKEEKDETGNYVKAVNKSGQYMSDSSKKYIVSIEHIPVHGLEKIERFKSPIFFKIIDETVFLGIDDSYENILDQKFSFTLRLKGDLSGTQRNVGQLKVPKNFDLADFIDNHLSDRWLKL